MKYEAWRISYQSSEQAARAAFEMYTKAEQSKTEAIREAVKVVLSLYGHADLGVEDIYTIADRYVDNVIIKGCVL
jgi:hypothetical protein